MATRRRRETVKSFLKKNLYFATAVVAVAVGWAYVLLTGFANGGLIMFSTWMIIGGILSGEHYKELTDQRAALTRAAFKANEIPLSATRRHWSGWYYVVMNDESEYRTILVKGVTLDTGNLALLDKSGTYHVGKFSLRYLS